MRKTVNGESSLVTTEEAKEITAVHRVCRDTRWDICRSSQYDHTEQTFECFDVPEDEYGMTTEGLTFGGTYTFGKITTRKKLTLTLWKRDKETRNSNRVVQLDSRRPLNMKGKQTDKNWPHIHFGQERISLDERALKTTIDVVQAAKMFEEKSNISFDPKLQDPNKLVLLP